MRKRLSELIDGDPAYLKNIKYASFDGPTLIIDAEYAETLLIGKRTVYCSELDVKPAISEDLITRLWASSGLTHPPE